jgi:hypothetical protein
MIGLWIGLDLDWNHRQGGSTTSIFDNFKDNLDYCRRRCSSQVVEEKEKVMTSTNKSCNNNVYNNNNKSCTSYNYFIFLFFSHCC